MAVAVWVTVIICQCRRASVWSLTRYLPVLVEVVVEVTTVLIVVVTVVEAATFVDLMHLLE